MAAAGLLLAACAAGTDQGDEATFREAQCLLASDGAAYDRFGGALAMTGDGSVLVVGAYGDDNDRGSAYIWSGSASAWTQAAKLTASDGDDEDYFGCAVAISSDGAVVVVGACADDIGANGDQGSAYVFVRPGGGWSGDLTETARLTAAAGAAGDRFGTSVSVSADGSAIVVGSAWDSVGSNQFQGSCYVYERPGGGWSGSLTESAWLTASDGAATDNLGVSVCLSADGSVAASGSGGAEATYIFERPAGGWSGSLSESAVLKPSTASLERFGIAVSLSADGASLTAGADLAGGDARGAAYVFVRPGGGWTGSISENAVLSGSTASSQANLGNSISLAPDGSCVAAGAPGDDVGTSASEGSAYVFVRPEQGWSGSLNETARLIASDGAMFEQIGRSVLASAAGQVVLVGAPHHDVGPFSSRGAVYVFAR